LDEAYYEFGVVEQSFPDSMHYRFDNVITLRTFSKAYGLAAARVGYGFAHKDLISVLLKVKLPFEPSGPSEAAALGALEDREFMIRTVANNVKGLLYLTRNLRQVGFEVVPSAGNFVMIALKDPPQAKHIFQSLLERGVIIRPLATTGLPSCLRISVGTPEENEYFLNTLRQILHDGVV
jgi:histidinol-phosphate aminotransferase